MPDLSFETSLRYSNEQSVPVEQIAEALLAFGRIAKRTPKAIERIFPTVTVDRVDVFLTDLTEGSIIEDFVIKIGFGDQAGFDKAMDDFRKKVRLDSVEGKTVLIALLAGFAAMGGVQACNMLAPDAPTTHLTANGNRIIAIGAEALDMPPEILEAIIRAALDGDEEENARDAVAVVGPARRERGAQIMFDGSEDLVISPEAVLEVPREVVRSDPPEVWERFRDTRVNIRATDRDFRRQGWGVVIPESSDRRIRLQVDIGVDLDSLAHQDFFYGDVMVMTATNPRTGEMVPRLARLLRISRDEDGELIPTDPEIE